LDQLVPVDLEQLEHRLPARANRRKAQPNEGK